MEPVKEKKKKAKMLRKPRSPPGPRSSICFHGDLGLVFNLSTGERLSLRGSSKFQLNPHQQACTGDGALTCAESYLFSPPFLSLEWKQQDFFVIITPSTEASKLREMLEE